jgi:hypothetical protein
MAAVLREMEEGENPVEKIRLARLGPTSAVSHRQSHVTEIELGGLYHVIDLIGRRKSGGTG